MTKKELCKDQREGLIAKLTAFFKGLGAEVIDDVVAEAKKQVNAETVEDHKNGLAKLFDSQMETLKSRNCPQAILEAFQNKKSEVLSKAAEMEVPEGHIPFIPVIPRSYMGIYGLMPMVRNGDKVGYTYLDPNEITDEVETPKNPYFIYDVEDGKDVLGKSPEKVGKLIKEQKRFCLTADEGIAVCVHTNVLSEHYVDCTGSRYRHSDDVPDVYLVDDRPRLDWSSAGASNGKWGSASCRSRA
ncbi:MAG: DUF5701 family protein [bacterium]